MQKALMTAAQALFFCALTSALPCHAAAQSLERRVQFSPNRVELSGVLVERRKYGPPGWGETPKRDRVLTAKVLLLDHPITIVANPSSDINSQTIRGVKEVQLIDIRKYRSDLGRRIFVSGILNTATTGWAFTKAVMTGVEVLPVQTHSTH